MLVPEIDAVVERHVVKTGALAIRRERSDPHEGPATASRTRTSRWQETHRFLRLMRGAKRDPNANLVQKAYQLSRNSFHFCYSLVEFTLLSVRQFKKNHERKSGNAMKPCCAVFSAADIGCCLTSSQRPAAGDIKANSKTVSNMHGSWRHHQRFWMARTDHRRSLEAFVTATAGSMPPDSDESRGASSDQS